METDQTLGAGIDDTSEHERDREPLFRSLDIEWLEIYRVERFCDEHRAGAEGGLHGEHETGHVEVLS